MVASLARRHAGRLAELQAEQRHLEREDFVWHYMLQSFSTWGSSRGWEGLMRTPANYERVRFEALLPLSPEARVAQAEAAFRDARMRMPAKKARLLASNLERIVAMGGLTRAREALFAIPGAEGKVAFLTQFEGIGPKYARNILMDVYHPDFRDRIAIDQRVKRVTDALGLSFDSYEAHERFLVEAAHEAGVDGWILDRILYNFTDEVLRGVRGDAAVAPGAGLRDRLLEAVARIDAGEMGEARRLVVEVAEAMG